jgi:FkbM family methyltransferase
MRIMTDFLTKKKIALDYLQLIGKSVFEQVKSIEPTGWQGEDIYVDWIGNKWLRNFFPHIPSQAENIELPVNGDGIRAGKLEWLAFGLALDGLMRSGDKFSVLVELGSSQAPWCLSWIRAIEKLTPEIETLTIGVEAGLRDNQISDFWSAQHLSGKVSQTPFVLGDIDFTTHYLSANEKQRFTILQAALTYKKTNYVFFPEIDITKDNGASMSKKDKQEDYRGFKVKHKKVKAVSFSEIIDLVDKIDFLHMDLQGEELHILRYFLFHQFSNKCKVMLIGTHTRRAHYLSQIVLRARGYKIVGSNSPKFRDDKLIEDGEVFVISKKLFSQILSSERSQ